MPVFGLPLRASRGVELTCYRFAVFICLGPLCLENVDVITDVGSYIINILY